MAHNFALTPDDIAAAEAIEKERMSILINAERDRRIALGFSYMGHVFQFDDVSKARVTGAATLAGFAVAAGAQANDYRWNGQAVDFTWLSKANSNVLMDAQSMFGMGQAAAEHERLHVFAARALKDATPIPADFTNDSHWPAAPT